MVLVWLVGEHGCSGRFLADRSLVEVKNAEYIKSAFAREGWELESTTGYVLRGGHIFAEVDPDVSVEVEESEIQLILQDGLMVLYRVRGPAVETISDQRFRHLVDVCLAQGCAVDAVSPLLKELNVSAGYTVIERVWHEVLILRDLAFLADTTEAREERRLYLLHDLCPLTRDMSDGRKLGHLTVGYRDTAGSKWYHTVQVYQELSSAGTAQEGVLKRTFEYFNVLCEL